MLLHIKYIHTSLLYVFKYSFLELLDLFPRRQAADGRGLLS